MEKLKKKKDEQARASQGQFIHGKESVPVGTRESRVGVIQGRGHGEDLHHYGEHNHHTAGSSGLVDYNKNTITSGPVRHGQSHAVSFIDSIQQNIKGKTSGLQHRNNKSANPMAHLHDNK